MVKRLLEKQTHQILSPVRLPISPLSQVDFIQLFIFRSLTRLQVTFFLAQFALK
jgi:hypothetical protein